MDKAFFKGYICFRLMELVSTTAIGVGIWLVAVNYNWFEFQVSLLAHLEATLSPCFVIKMPTLISKGSQIIDCDKV